jgi:isoleucyl-tRNA synthetase
MFAPILAFTCDEIWLSMPHTGDEDERNVLLNQMNAPFAAYSLGEAEMAVWDDLVRVRDDVNGVIETARAAKRIGKPLEAAVRLQGTDGESREVLDKISDMGLAELFIVSQCLIAPDEDGDDAAAKSTGAAFPGLEISVREAPGTKCPRCWIHSEAADPETGLCPRCAEVLKTL